MPPALPPAQQLLLPGRGRTCVYDSGSGSGSGPGSGPGSGGGAGPALLLLHGWTSTAALNFHRCFAVLTPNFRVVAMDHRGHGRGIRSRLPFRLEDCADDAAAVVDVLQLGPTIVLGYSMGGPIAQLMWRRRPDAVAGLVLCATAARFPEARYNGAVGTLAAGLSVGLSLLPSPVRRAGMGYAYARLTANGEWAAWAAEEWRRHDPAALLQAGMAISRFDSTGWIGDVDVPTSVVLTEDDTKVSPRRQRHLAESIPGAVTFPVAANHRAIAEAPDVFLPALVAACRSVRDRSSSQEVTG